MAINGILNDEKRAMELAYQNAETLFNPATGEKDLKPTTIYLMHVKPANNPLSELMGTAYEKATNSMSYGLANFLGYTNAAETYAGALASREDRATNSLGHSAGTLRQESGHTILTNRPDESGKTYTNPNLTVRGVGGAADAISYTDATAKVQGPKGDKGTITYSYFSNDPVSTSTFSGGNPGVTHQWPVVSNCKYSKLPTLGRKNDRYKGEIYAVDDIYEDSGSTKQRGAHPAWNFDRFVRSAKRQVPIYAPATKAELDASDRALWERIERSRKSGVMQGTPADTTARKPIRFEEKDFGFQAVCGEVWQATSHILSARLYKRDLASWRAMLSESNPKGKWSERRIGANVWLAQETTEQDFKPRPLNGAAGGPFQTWILPIGDTGYTFALYLDANLESLQHPDAHARFQAAYRHLIESVKIEPLKP